MKIFQKYIALIAFIFMAVYIWQMVNKINLTASNNKRSSQNGHRNRKFVDKPCIVDNWTRIDQTTESLNRDIFCDEFAEQSDILCRWYLDQQNITDHKTCLLPQDGYKVPNVVFYVTFGHYEFTLLHYMCILSAKKIQRPLAIYVIGDEQPLGKWWKKLCQDVSDLRFIRRQQPKEIFGIHVYWVAHASDIVRLQILLANGGIYMDTDQIFVKNFNPIRNYTITMGIIDRFTGMGNAVISTERHSTFLQQIYDNYRTYNSTNYYKNSLKYSYELWERNHKALHLESLTFYRPLWSELHKLYNTTGFNWRKRYAVHIWSREKKYPLPETISDVDKLNTTLGELFRHVYYGDSRLRL
ncbi:uncharacterized protein LOC126809888 [Patella vulgata]|uniref:uncharacterized protein LOC126809888 n=1 Tax=Patella vulgata TaxID=6465 RepID=UPI0021806716|nr:uncharacterized protein LOC126809888 [Patella vulgata]